jgi:redox-sensitive bicupin YhaK (pirin superfamily)
MKDDGRDGFTRREVLVGTVASATLSALPGCDPGSVPPARTAGAAASTDAVLHVEPLGSVPWKTFDPFLFCVHHDDAYPEGNEQLGPAASLAGRKLGMDFEGVDGWRMYHGQNVPGFPQHPHRGFETVTVVRRGFIDHADSLGATARYGAGDTQWLTAGAGIVHAEMFPLLERGSPNPLELFQIWLNLPSADKFATPHFSMLWREQIPTRDSRDAAGKRTSVTIVAGKLGDASAPLPPPRSWAARADSDVAIWTIAMEPGARFTLPKAASGTSRALYFFRGEGLHAGLRPVPAHSLARLRPDAAVELVNGDGAAELLLLQGRPIGEPVVSHGPFVMNSGAEIQQAFMDYRRTGFGGWPWPSHDPVHARESGRFAVHADGRNEAPPRSAG